MLFINLKNYPIDTTIFLENLVKLYQDKYSHIKICILPSVIELTDVRRILPSKIKVYAQTVDELDSPKTTGKITLAKLVQNGITGCMINHSENPKPIEEMEEITQYCNNYGLECMLGFQNLNEFKHISILKANYYLYEPADLIGNSHSRDSKSVIESKKSELILMKNNYQTNDIIIGAGIKSEEDFKQTYSLEFAGVALSSIITESENIMEKLDEIMSYENEYGK